MAATKLLKAPAARAGAIYKSPPEKTDRHFVTALARGLGVLSCFRSGDKILGNQEIAERCKLPKSTVSRLTHTLTKLGYLNYVDEYSKYRLGPSTLSLGSAMLARLDVRQIARPLMQELADFSQGMVSLGTRDRLHMIYVENCRSKSALTLSLDVGSRIALATTAMGRAYLAECTDAERGEILGQIRASDAAAWPKMRAGIEAALETYRKHRYCVSFGEWQKDVNAIAIAFRPGFGLPIMAVNCGGPSFTLEPKFLLKEVQPRLLKIVEQIEASCGHT